MDVEKKKQKGILDYIFQFAGEYKGALTDFEGMLASQDGDPGLAFFAEQFGYRRFCMAYETDDPLQLRISRLLYEMEFAETRQMVGPSPEVSFPPFFGLVPAE